MIEHLRAAWADLTAADAPFAMTDASLTSEQLQQHLAPVLAKHKIPSQIWFLDEPLPRNASGKFVKRELRDRLLASA